jgi:peptide/nickel transport system substrate-binding protein
MSPVHIREVSRHANPLTRRAFLKCAVVTPVALTVLGAARQAHPAPKRGGTFITLGHADVSSLSPQDPGLTAFVLVANMHEGLVTVDENYNVTPRLAQSYDVSADGKLYTFKLRRGVKWHDGADFTAADVKYTYEWVMNPDNASMARPSFAEVETVETPDPSTVIVRLKEPSAPFLVRAALWLIVPKHYHQAVGEKEYKRRPIGTGPYKFKAQEVGKYVLLEAFDQYWGGRPYIDFYREDIVPEPSVRAIALETGKADSSIWALAPEDTLRFMEHPKFQHFRAPELAVNHFILNNQRAVFQEKRVRQALLYALDRDAMVKDLFKGLAVKATANLSPASTQYYEPGVKQYPYDPARAKELLADAGWKPGADGILVNARGERFSVVCDIYPGDAVRRIQAEMAQRNFRDVGIEMRLRELEAAAHQQAARAGNHEVQLFNATYGGGGGDPDAHTALTCAGLYNRSKWCNQDAERLLDEGAKTLDPQQRRKIYSELQKLVAEEVPFLYVSFWDNVVLFPKRIKGLPAAARDPRALYWNRFHTFWIEE